MLDEQQTSQCASLLQRVDQALAKGDREKVVLILLTKMSGVPLPAINRLCETPAWLSLLPAAHTIPRELRVRLCLIYLRKKSCAF